MTPEQRLRAAFEAHADRVEVAPDALGTIRGRIARRGHRRRWEARLAGVAIGLAAAVTAGVIGLASCVPVPAPPPPPVATTGPSPTPGPTPSPGPSGVTVRVPVYAVGRSNPLLYREFRSVAAPTDSPTDRIGAAVRLMLAGPPLDPDYATAWPAGIGVGPVSLAGSVATVDLTGVGDATAIRDPTLARAAVQQLVWTVTAVAADRGSTLSPARLAWAGIPLSPARLAWAGITLTGVRVTLGGSAPATLWGVPVAGVLTRADALATLAPIWVVSPQQADTVATTFTVQLDGSAFEAAVRLRSATPTARSARTSRCCWAPARRPGAGPRSR